MAKAILIRAWIDRARADSTDQTDAATAVVLRTWRDAAMDNLNAGVKITSVTFSGEGQSGEIEMSSEELVEITQAAIESLEDDRDAGSGVTRFRYRRGLRT